MTTAATLLGFLAVFVAAVLGLLAILLPLSNFEEDSQRKDCDQKLDD